MPSDLLAALSDPGCVIVAHNAAFERTVLTGRAGTVIGIPDIADLDRWSCTASRAAAIGLARGLDQICRALELPLQKDAEGHALMRRVCSPREDGSWIEDAASMERMAAYCAADVAAEALLDRRLPELSAVEREVWLSTEKMNDRGVLADLQLVGRIIDLVSQALPAVNARILELTGARTVNCRVALKAWFTARGIELQDTRKATVADLLEEELPDDAHEVLELMRDGGGTSHTKAAVLARRVSADGRLRGELVYCGAAQTGRWSSSGVQLQNIRRHKKELRPRAIIADLAAGARLDWLEQFHGPALQVASELLRPSFIAPPGGRLVWLDFASIEARVVAWLAGDEDTLEVFRAWDARSGAEPYVVAARDIYGQAFAAADDNQRDIGKVATLALGFAGGVGALRVMARAYGVKLPPDEAVRIVRAWRDAHPVIVQFWAAVGNAAMELVSSPVGTSIVAGRITLRRERRAIVLVLPSDRPLVYWKPELRLDEDDRVNLWHARARGADSRTYGGKICQNATQAVARDLLARGLIALDAAGFNPLLTIHDEIILQTDRDPKESERIMTAPPEWADGLPIVAETFSGDRYLKG
jgi:DNA polymerase bacteriophage-type